MRSAIVLAASIYLAMGVAGQSLAAETASRSAPAKSPFPLQVEMRVPFAPTAFPSGGQTYLVYELYVTNFLDAGIAIQQLDVLDADRSATEPVATFGGQALDSMLQSIGANGSPSDSSTRRLAAGATDIVYMWISFGPGAHVPNHLRHRLVTSDSAVEGAPIGTHHVRLITLGPPLEGATWRADDGPSNAVDNHHRRGVVILDGRPVDSRRYAIDWMKFKNRTSFSGDSLDRRSYYAYGQPVLAVADATVVAARDGLPENVPGHGAVFHPAVPITLDNVGGNTITLDLGDGQFAYYFHLQPGSLRVKTGARVRRGEEIARVGCSGDAREPHLHFEVTTSPELLAGEGVPYVIDGYRTRNADHTWQPRSRELPLDGMLVDFGVNGRP